MQPRWPKAAQVLAATEDDVLAYMAFPMEHWTRIYSTNPLERLNREIKRPTDVVSVFPDEASVVRLVGAVLMERADEWEVERRSFSLESMRKLTAPEPESLFQLEASPHAFGPHPLATRGQVPLHNCIPAVVRDGVFRFRQNCCGKSPIGQATSTGPMGSSGSRWRSCCSPAAHYPPLERKR